MEDLPPLLQELGEQITINDGQRLFGSSTERCKDTGIMIQAVHREIVRRRRPKGENTESGEVNSENRERRRRRRVQN